MTRQNLSLWRQQSYVGGRWIDADENATRAVDDPATGERRKMQEVWAEARSELVGAASCVPKSEPFKCKLP